MNYDGVVVIGTKLDTGQLEKELKLAQNELRELEKESEQLEKKKIKIDLDLTEYNQKIEELHASYDEYLQGAQTTEQVENTLAMEEKELQKINEKYQEQLEKVTEINTKIEENANAQQLVANRIDEINLKLDQTEGLDDFNKKIDNIGKSIGKQIKQVVRWGLALVGIRTVLSILSRSFNTLKSYNEELAERMEQMQLMLAVALEPVIKAIINLAQYLLNIIAQIYQLLFGINLYDKANEYITRKNAQNLASGAKSAKEMRKQLAGFDEMNVLNDNVAGSGGGGSKLIKPEEGELPKWMQELIKYGDLIIATLAGVISALTLMKLGLSAIKAIGIGLVIGGVTYAIRKLLKYLKNPNWKNFGGIVEGIGVALVGLGVITNNYALVVAGAITFIMGLVNKYWDSIQESIKKGLDWLYSKGNWLRDHNLNIVAAIYENIISALALIWDKINLMVVYIRDTFDGVIRFFKGVFTLNWEEAWGGLVDIVMANVNYIWYNIVAVFDNIKRIATSWYNTLGSAFGSTVKGIVNAVLGSAERVINDFISLLNGVLKVANKLTPGIKIGQVSKVSLPRLAKGGIINQPGRGVMVGNAIAGERGAEGVIPLTDSQQMALLGEAIGKYITINANITNTMNGKVISRELQKIQNSNDFAYNR